MTDWSATALNDAVNALTAAGTYIALYNGAPGSGGTEISGGSYARVATGGAGWTTASAGSATGNAVTINVPAGATISYFAVFAAVSGGSYLFGAALASSETYGSAGTYTLTPTVTATGNS